MRILIVIVLSFVLTGTFAQADSSETIATVNQLRCGRRFDSTLVGRLAFISEVTIQKTRMNASGTGVTSSGTAQRKRLFFSGDRTYYAQQNPREY